ncbi:MAG: aminotransferase class V-fold PLP-dependent enzyme [Bacillota bacterium]|nr:aminotransferase class V-fold PLP-dependent enzyme [Bacillota bacterium]
MPRGAPGEGVPCLRDLFLLRPDVVFLNHGSFGARPRSVFEAYQRWQLELEQQPVEFLGRRFTEVMRGAREAVAAYLGAQADDLVFVPNATTGLNVVARSLPLAPGDEVLTSNHEYGALDSTWRFVCSGRGASYIHRPIPLPVASPEEVVEAIWAGVTPRTRVIFLSHITSPTALTFPVSELVQRARAANILTVIDGAHVPGQRPLSLDKLGADFYSGNLHKWLCAPAGSGFLHARREVQHLLKPLVVSWGWNRTEQLTGPRDPRQIEGRFVDEQEWQGTRDPSAYLAAPEAIRFQAENDWPRVRAECHELLLEARRRIAELTGLPAICPASSEWFSQMAAFPLPRCDAVTLKRRLHDEYRVEVPIVEWNGRQMVRVSIQGYNTLEDVRALVAALAALLPEVAISPA